jgi:hypothetical protein
MRGRLLPDAPQLGRCGHAYHRPDVAPFPLARRNTDRGRLVEPPARPVRLMAFLVQAAPAEMSGRQGTPRTP